MLPSPQFPPPILPPHFSSPLPLRYSQYPPQIAPQFPPQVPPQMSPPPLAPVAQAQHPPPSADVLTKIVDDIAAISPGDAQQAEMIRARITQSLTPQPQAQPGPQVSTPASPAASLLQMVSDIAATSPGDTAKADAIRNQLLSALAPPTVGNVQGLTSPAPPVNDSRLAGLRTDLQGQIDSIKTSVSNLDGKVVNLTGGLADLRVAQEESATDILTALDELRGRPSSGSGPRVLPPAAPVPLPVGSAPNPDPLGSIPGTFAEAIAFITQGSSFHDVRINEAIHTELCSSVVLSITTRKINIPWEEDGSYPFENWYHAVAKEKSRPVWVRKMKAFGIPEVLVSDADGSLLCSRDEQAKLWLVWLIHKGYLPDHSSVKFKNYHGTPANSTLTWP